MKVQKLLFNLSSFEKILSLLPLICNPHICYRVNHFVWVQKKRQQCFIPALLISKILPDISLRRDYYTYLLPGVLPRVMILRSELGVSTFFWDNFTFAKSYANPPTLFFLRRALPAGMTE